MKPYDFLKFLKNSKCLIGNSSVGIRECAYLGVPVVNIGTRQNGRERGVNVLDTNYQTSSIQEAIQQQVKHGVYPSDNIYGKGNAGTCIANHLSQVPLTYHKMLNY